MTAKRSGKAYYMISAVAQRYNIHPQTLRLYEREGLLRLEYGGVTIIELDRLRHYGE